MSKHIQACIQTVRGAVALGWCHDANRHKEMDIDLVEAITQEVLALTAAAIRTLKESAMTPTQAQIEAARKEYINRCGHYSPPSNETFSAILTAAAEAGGEKAEDRTIEGAALTAAVEAGEGQLWTTPEMLRDKLLEVEAATIERCIQKIELYIVRKKISGEVQGLINDISWALKD